MARIGNNGKTAEIFFKNRCLHVHWLLVIWTVNGLPDFVVSNLNAPVCIAKNISNSRGNYLDVQLIGTEDIRDAVGAVATLKRVIVSGSGKCWRGKLYGNQRSHFAFWDRSRYTNARQASRDMA